MDVLVRLARWLYAPMYFLGFLAAAIALVASGSSKMLLLGLLAAAIAMAFLAELLIPYEPVWNRSRGDRLRDIWHALVNESLIVVPLLAMPAMAALTPANELWPQHWPLGLQLALAIIIADLGITAVHYLSHRWGWLWRLHAVHHSVQRMYGFNGLMKHPLHQALEMLAGVTPLLLGMSPDVAWLLAFAVAVQLLLQHSNADMRIGPLSWIWAVAPVHRHHHLASTTQGDVNFGLFTCLGDHLLGTWRYGHPAPRDGAIGIADEPDYPGDYLGQLRAPFRHRAAPEWTGGDLR